jgi:iduronate 2-sulfatase
MPSTLLAAIRSIAAVLLAASAAGAQTAATHAPRPNVLLIMADDLNDHLGTFGHGLVPTPNLDRLASRGVRFTRAYTQFPLCSPSRVSMLTGLRPDRTRIYDLQTDFRTNLPEVVTLPQLFRRQGYVAARVGKIYHYGNPGQIGTSGLDDPASWDAVVNPRGVDKDEEKLLTNLTPKRGLGAALAYFASPAPDDAHTDGKVAAETVALLERHRDRPFFIGAGFYRPHCPFIAPRKYFDRIPRDRVVLPASPADGSLSPLAWNTVPPHWGVDEAGQREIVHAYYASIAFLDANVGLVLDALDRLDLWKNTIVVFVSDHGYQLGEKGQWMKQTLFERSLRSPLIVAAPGLGRRGGSSARIVELLDVYPTIADLAGLAAPTGLQGRSLRPLLADPDAAWERPAISQVRRVIGSSTSMGYSVRTTRWRYTEWDQGASGVELYDETADGDEARNLAADPAHAATLSTLRRHLQEVYEAAR